jgi:glycosyltransferase involved in cell wall biosynthesis
VGAHEPAGAARRGRVLVLVENLSVPLDRRVWQECRALGDAGYDVAVICPRGATQDTERHVVIDGIDIHRYRPRPSPGGLLGYVREYGGALARMLWRSLRLGRFDIVHICNPPDLLVLVALPAKLRGARLIFDQHDLVPELYLSRFGRGTDAVYRGLCLLERLTYRLADVVISTNESYRRVALSRGGMRPERVFVVRNAPDLARFSEVPADPELRRGKRYLLCYLGVMGPQDGVDYALRALAWLRHHRERADWHATFVGSGDSFDAMVDLSRRLGLDDVVSFAGWLQDEDLLRHLASADVCLAPDPLNALNDVSTMTKIMEYMAMSRPIVSFDLRETRVSAGDAALYAPANDEAEFARLVARLLDDPAERERLGALGRERVRTALSWTRSRETLLEAYRVAGER